MQAPPKIAYFDTNILSHLVHNQQLWPTLQKFLTQNNYVLGISSAHAAELSEATRQHQTLAELFTHVPSGILKTSEAIFAEEVDAYPQKRAESLLAYRFEPSDADNLQQIQDFLSSQKLALARQDQLRYAQQMPKRYSQLQGNFPPSKTGKFTVAQADEFAWTQVLQWLGQMHRDFLLRFQNDIGQFHTEMFLSIRLFAHVIFYKYYIGQRTPRKISDFGDLAHVFFLPYCGIVIMERDLCNILNQIKRNHDTLTTTAIHTINFFDNWRVVETREE